MVLSSNIFVQPFTVFPSHILLYFQSYHLQTPSSLLFLPFVSQLPIQYSCPLRIYFKPLPQPLASVFFSPPLPFNYVFLFPCPTLLGVFPSLSEGPTLCPPPALPSILYVPEGDAIWSTGHTCCLLLVQACEFSPSPTVAQRQMQRKFC